MMEDSERMASSDYCIKDLAVQHLRERERCAAKADRYVDYVFEKCKEHRSPFAGSGSGGLRKNVSNIL